MKLLEVHLLQSFGPELLNRDDTGSHKECIFGGQRRARVSSQSWKKAVRDYVKALELLPAEKRATRSKRLHEALKQRLADNHFNAETADYLAEAALVYVGAFHVETPLSDDEQSPYSQRELKSEYLVFLGNDSVSAVVELLTAHPEAAKAAAEAVSDYRHKLRSNKNYKGALDDKGKENLRKAVEKTLGKDVSKTLERAFDGSKAIDLALFGRMLADLPSKNIDGSAQVAHAVSTHTAFREYDYYTAVDDLKPEDTAGADMIGTVEFNAACYYRYAALDLAKLQKNLEDDHELIKAGLEVFLRAFVEAIPSGKQNSFAAHNPPSFGALRVQDNAQPHNLMNAFERPVPKGSEGYVRPSIRELDAEWQWVDTHYGDSGEVYYWLRADDVITYLRSKTRTTSAHEAIRLAVERAMTLLES